MAAARCISRAGFKAATMTSIAREAGVTWGAIQHHFGNKEAILDAVIEAGALGLRAGLQMDNVQFLALEVRIDQLLIAYEQKLGSPLYQANITIQRNEPELFAGSRASRLQQEIVDMWQDLFGDLKIPKQRMDDIRDFTFITLNGIAMFAMTFAEGRKGTKTHLGFLRENLLSMLAK
jgi:AcrR family transcriptional regulator